MSSDSLRFKRREALRVPYVPWDRVLFDTVWCRPRHYFSVTKQCVQRQQGCLQCCRASCRLGMESTAEVVHKSAVATWCVSEQKEKIEKCRLLLTDSQSQVCLGDEKE